MNMPSDLSTLPTTANAPAGFAARDPIDLADRLAVAYLALPALIFFLGWFSLEVGALLALLLLVGLSPLLGARGGELRFGPSLGVALIAIAAALAWTSLGGAGHFVYANADWPTRDTVLRDLVLTAWPPSYGTLDGTDIILRSPVAYYLPAASLGKVLGLESADFLLFLWTTLGVGLFLMIALSSARTPRKVIVALLVIVFFSGMDIVGALLFRLPRPGLTDHLEWWTGLFQYSANTTQLFWVPNHALPGWLVAALIYKNWKNPEFLKIAPIALAVTPLWSPLPTIGLAPFAILLAWHHLREGTWRAGVLPWAWLGAVATLAATGYYLTLDGTRIPSGWTANYVNSLGGLAIMYAAFVFFEFGFLTLTIWRIRRDALIAVSFLTLLLLPLYRFGPGNDLAMRASIPALTILCLSAIDALSEVNWSERPKLAVPLLFCLTIGSVTAIHEIARAGLFPRWQPALGRNLIEMSRGLPPHYVARLNAPLLGWAMRSPAPVPGLAVRSSK